MLELFDSFAPIVSSASDVGTGASGVTEGGAVSVTDEDAADDLKSQAATDENVPRTKILSETLRGQHEMAYDSGPGAQQQIEEQLGDFFL